MSLTFNKDVFITEEELFNRLKGIKIGGNVCRYSLKKCTELTPIINEINQLKQEKKAVILAHSYVSPEIIYGVSDFVGDSYKLAKDVLTSKAEVIIFVAVKFMAETAKIINPTKRVFIPSKLNGCSLADSITSKEVELLKARYPKHAIVSYINTNADVKAHSDVIVTSSNVYDIVEKFPNDKIIFLPDKLMGENLIFEMKRRGVKKEIVLHSGTCYVHENYDPEMIDFLKLEYQDLSVLVHPECSSAMVAKSDFAGSTSQLINHVKKTDHENYLLLTECGLADRLKIESPDKNFVGSCTMCRYMKSNNLMDILRVLKNPQKDDEVTLREEIIFKAKRSLDNMFKYAK